MHRGFLPFHITMGNDGISSTTNALCPRRHSSYLSYYIYWQNLQSATQ
jgi:hypothetical protein